MFDISTTSRAVAARSLLLGGPTDLLICDPCYLIENSQHWRQFIGQLYDRNGQPTVLADGGLLLLPSGGVMLYGTTATGDGFYEATATDTCIEGQGAAVDSGMLCLISTIDAMIYAGGTATAWRPDLSLQVAAVHGTIETDGQGRFTAPAVGLILDTTPSAAGAR